MRNEGGDGEEFPESGGAGAPASRRRVGEIIDAKYEIIRLLGEGGMGVVYEAKHRLIGRRFALKFLHVDMARSGSMLTRFRREAEAAGRLENENVVAVVDFGATPDGAPFLVMEYLQGVHLGRCLRESGPLAVGRAVRLVLQVCRGLQAAHELGIIHRDLKPENLFLVSGSDGGEIVKILDFGIAKLKAEAPASMTNSGLTLGTPYYMSPEQARGDRHIDERTDIFAIGVILYELLTCEKPHPGENATAVLFHLLKQEPKRIEALRADLPLGLADVVHRAFSFDADARFKTVAELSAALAPYESDGTELRARRPSQTPCEPALALSTTQVQVEEKEEAAARPSVSAVAHASSAAPKPGRSRAWRWSAVACVVAVGVTLVSIIGAYRRQQVSGARPSPTQVTGLSAVTAPELPVSSDQTVPAVMSEHIVDSESGPPPPGGLAATSDAGAPVAAAGVRRAAPRAPAPPTSGEGSSRRREPARPLPQESLYEP